MTSKTALIVGATGLVGRLLLQSLLASADYHQVIVLARRSSGITHAKLTEHVVDFGALPDLAVQIDDVFCCLGTTIKVAGSQAAFYQVDCTYPLNVATWAQGHGATQFVMVSALGASPESSVYYNRVKGEVEQKITALNFNTTIFARPSLLIGERTEYRLGERIALFLTPLFHILLVGSLKKYRPIKAAQVAHAMLELAQQPRTGVHVFESDALQTI